LKNIAKAILLKSLWHGLGRKNLVRLSRFLYNEARLDKQNDAATNGERAVQWQMLKKDQSRERFCVFDVGANVGNWTQSLLEIGVRLNRPIFVHAFEGCINTCLTLENNLEQSGFRQQTQVNNIVLSSSKGKQRFYSRGSNAGTNGLYPLREVNSEEQTVVEVETETIDGYCVQNGIFHIDFLKVDTEGHDIEVLYGGNELFTAGAIDIAQFEYNHRWINSRHYLRDAFDYFKPLGYELGKITPKGIEFYPAWDFELETFREGNYLAVKPSLMSLFPQIPWWKE
jgi:FkbM family methyltransferase